jgi:N-glycosylase/DNA lyase
MEDIEEIRKIWNEVGDQIKKRIEEFESMWVQASEEELFTELAFCLLTPQSKATVCWRAIENLRDTGILWFGNSKDIEKYLIGVRFKYTKAENIVRAREFFKKEGKISIRDVLSQFNTPLEIRDFLVRNIRGMGYKEASHFLRNVGLGRDLAILDRHILKNLKALGVIEDIPKGLTRKRYLEIEERMRLFAEKIGIRMDYLDLILWYKETGRVFK